MAAECYQQSSLEIQMEGGKMFIQTDVLPQPGDTILDLGCGTGELSAYIAELVGPEGYVVGVDPDSTRLKVARETHSGVKNLSFVEGNSDNFEGMDSKKYDIIFLNQVFHWISNKELAFKNMFSSLKASGKIAMRYLDALPKFIVVALKELSPESEERYRKLLYYVPKLEVDHMCTKAGFDIVKSYSSSDMVLTWASMDDFLKWAWASTNGVFDLKVVTQERVQRFLSRVGNPPFDFSADFIDIKLIAVKPKDHSDGSK